MVGELSYQVSSCLHFKELYRSIMVLIHQPLIHTQDSYPVLRNWGPKILGFCVTHLLDSKLLCYWEHLVFILYKWLFMLDAPHNGLSLHGFTTLMVLIMWSTGSLECGWRHLVLSYRYSYLVFIFSLLAKFSSFVCYNYFDR